LRRGISSQSAYASARKPPILPRSQTRMARVFLPAISCCA